MTTALAIASFVIAVIALTVNVSGLVRRPRIVAEWGYVHDQPPMEGMVIIVTARRRPVEIDEIGIVLLPRKYRLRRKMPEWLNEQKPFRVRLGHREKRGRLEDGQSMRAFAETDSMADELHGHAGVAYPYVMASGTVYLGKNSKLARRLRRRVES